MLIGLSYNSIILELSQRKQSHERVDDPVCKGR